MYGNYIVTFQLTMPVSGTGACDHIGEKVSLPTPIPLNDGVFEVGRTEPADIVLKIPTVSSRHALLRVGKCLCRRHYT